MNSPGHRQPAAWLQPVGVHYEHNQDLPALKELAALFCTYQAGPVVSVGSYQGQMGMGLRRFDQAMGLWRTASVIAVSTRVRFGACRPIGRSRPTSSLGANTASPSWSAAATTAAC